MKKLSNDEIEYISKYYCQFGPTAIGIKLKRNTITISNCGKRLGLVLDKTNKKDISELPDFEGNSDIIEVLSKENMSPELAYFIGFFWADGTNGNNSIAIEIVEEDGLELQPLFKEIFNFNIKTRHRSGRKPQMTFRTGSVKASKLFTSLGKYPKSSENHSKVLEFVGEKYFRFFLLGLIDGDGCFYAKDNVAQFSISGNRNQDWSTLLEYLKDYSPSVHTEETKTGNSSILRIANVLNIRKLIKFLYSDTNLGLKRKREKANVILNTKYRMYDYPIIVRDEKYNSIKEFCVITGENHANVIKNLKNPSNLEYLYDEECG